jgi:hypothetical protein
MIIVYIMVAWFTILLFSSKNYFLCSVVILLASMLNIIIVDVYELTAPLSYIDEKTLFIKIDGLTAVILGALYAKDKLAVKMSLLLAFAVICHTMIGLELIASSSFLGNIFYTWYDELVMLIGISQMWISRNGLNSALRNIRYGLNSALRNIRGYILGVRVFSRHYSKSLFVRKACQTRGNRT